jgi:putative flippase GtrA
VISGRMRRFAMIGVANTTIDVALFTVLHASLGITLANFCSTSAGMVFSFWANGRFTFGSGRPTVRHAVLFLATTGSTMWVLQPLLIDAVVATVGGPVLLAKLVALAASVVANFVLYRNVVWRREVLSAALPLAGPDAARVVARR